MGSEATPATGGRDLVEALLPHRPPFLFVDRVLARDARSITVERDVREDEGWVRGHYPGNPVQPGVLTMELCFQAGALLLAGAGAASPGVPVATRIEDARFKRMVRPGETLRAEVELVEELANARYLKARVTSAGRTVLRTKFAVALAPPEPAGGGEPAP